MKKVTTLGAAAILSVASIGAQAQVQTINDASLSEVSGQIGHGLFEGTKPFLKARAINASVGIGALVAAPVVAAHAMAIAPVAATATYLAGPAIATASLAAIVPAQVAVIAVTPVAAAAALVHGHRKNGHGIRNAIGVMAAGTAAVHAIPVAGIAIATGAIVGNGPAAAAVLAAGPVVAHTAMAAGAATATVAGAAFVHNSAHLAQTITYNGISITKALLQH